MRAMGGIVLAALAMWGASPATAADPPKPLFASREPIHLTIRGPIGRVTAARTDAPPIDASLTVAGETLPIQLSTRGITRRAREVCAFPPLRVDFTGKPPATSLFRGQNRLKLVTHCRPSEAFQQYLLLEYAGYRMYNLLTPLSFNVRLATIDYVESNGKAVTSRLGFFIEDIDDAAKRNGLREPKTADRVSTTALSPRDAGRYGVFQYMIGNLDWSMVAGPEGSGCCHNSKLIGAEGAATGLVPVPYDFDFSGMVDAPYATPPEGIPVSNVRTRRYRGYCRLNAEAQAAAADLWARRASLLAVFDELPQLDGRTRAKATAYLGSFFDQVATPGDTAKLLRTCL